MRLNQYGNPIYNSQDVFNLLYQGKVDILQKLTVDVDTDIESLQTVSDIKFQEHLPEVLTNQDYDTLLQGIWFMPEKYRNFNIEEYIFSVTPPDDIYQTRVKDELFEYKQRNMMNLLRWLKYFVDSCTEKNIVWGVGRGSSVASYVLFLLGVHHIDSIRYNLDWREFLR